MSFFRSLFSFSRKEINEIFKEARLHSTHPGLKILHAPFQATHTHGKLLISVPKAYGNAPKRNKLRRQLKSIYYEQRLFEKPLIGIILIQKKRHNYSFEELQQILTTSFAP